MSDFVCPKCQKDCKSKLALDNHMRHKHSEGGGTGGQQGQKARKQGSVDKCPDCGAEGSYRLLNQRVELEKHYYDQGYREVCVKCQELR